MRIFNLILEVLTTNRSNNNEFLVMNINLINEVLNGVHTYDHSKIESPIEEIFINHLIKFLCKDTEIIVQYPLNTISGDFRADIALKKDDKIVLIECDGKDFHTLDKDDWYDEWRDTLILIQKRAHVIYRLKGKDIQRNLYKIIAMIYSYDKYLFNKEYIDRIDKVKIDELSYKKYVFYDYINRNNEKIPSLLEIKRKELEKDFDSFWFDYVLYSLLHRKKTIYKLIERMSSERYETCHLIKKVNEQYPNLNLKNRDQLLRVFDSYGNISLKK